MPKLTASYDENYQMIAAALRLEESFDLVKRQMEISGRAAMFVFVNGFTRSEDLNWVLQNLALVAHDLAEVPDADAFSRRCIPFADVTAAGDVDEIATKALSGLAVLLVDGYDKAFLMDVRQYPTRGIKEPETERLIRGEHSGFVETLVQNTAQIRRHIRDPRLTMERFTVGSASRTDVVLCYMAGLVKEKWLTKLRAKLSGVSIQALTMGSASLSECMVRKQEWYNPFPKIRFTERPDIAASVVMEGRLLLLVDTSPAAMILPTTLFDFMQDANDYAMPPMMGMFLRVTRSITAMLALFLSPVWFMLISNKYMIPSWLHFIEVFKPNDVPILAELLIVELVVNTISLAALKIPTAMSGAFGIIGALVLGQFGVETGWFVPDVLLIMAFITIAAFTEPTAEFGHAVRMFRLFFLVMTAIFGPWGLLAGVVLMLLELATTRTVLGVGYLYPLLPFDRHAISRLFVRRMIHKDNAEQKQ